MHKGCSYHRSRTKSLSANQIRRLVCALGRVWVGNGSTAFALDITTERDEYFLRGMVESFVTLRER